MKKGKTPLPLQEEVKGGDSITISKNDSKAYKFNGKPFTAIQRCPNRGMYHSGCGCCCEKCNDEYHQYLLEESGLNGSQLL